MLLKRIMIKLKTVEQNRKQVGKLIFTALMKELFPLPIVKV